MTIPLWIKRLWWRATEPSWPKPSQMPDIEYWLTRAAKEDQEQKWRDG